MGTTDGQTELLDASHMQKARELVALVAQGKHCLARDTLPRPSCSQLGTGFMILMGKSAGKGGGDGGIDEGVPPLPQHSSLLTERLLKTGLVHGWLGIVLSLLEHWGLGRLR